MRILIAEDEQLAQERIHSMVSTILPDAEIIGILDSKSDLRQTLLRDQSIDLLILDIELSDGKSIDLFKDMDIEIPVIFTTAYDQYALEAFQYLSVGYVLKPIQLKELKHAISKASQLILTTTQKSADNIWSQEAVAYKEKFLIKSGNKLVYKDVKDASYFYAEGKEVYLVQKDNRKFLIDHSLEELEGLLNPKHYFRISRKIILNIETVQEVRGLSNIRLEVKAEKGTLHPLLISRGRVKDFKAWLNR
jgi:DNA-binding LytR/AlgR family response regulator